MKTLKKEAALLLIVCAMLLLLPESVHAWEPSDRERTAGLKAGDIQPYRGKLTALFKQKLPAQITKKKLKALLKDRSFMDALIEVQFINKAWGMAEWAKKDPKYLAFVSWVMSKPKLMDKVLLARTPSSMFHRHDNSWSIEARYLDYWKQIYYADSTSREGLYLRLAIACALRPPGTQNQGAGMAKEKSTPLARYKHYREAHARGDLMPSFNGLSIWELTHVVSSGASNEDLAWGREVINNWGPWFRENEGVVGLTSQMKYQGSQIPYNNMGCLLGGGGKCGPRSSFGVFICQAWGIPANGLGQPAHAAVGFRDRNGNWQTAYGRGWNVSKIHDRGRMSGGEWLQRTKERKTSRFGAVEHLRWLAEALGDKSRKNATMAAADSIAKSLQNIIDTIPFDTKPDRKTVLRSFVAPTDVADSYGARVRGFVYPPRTGEYIFGVAADDMADLFLSTDDDPDNRAHIAHLREWAEPGNYRKYPTQQSKRIQLTAGRKYYIEAVHKEQGGGDHLSVSWAAGGASASVIPGSDLSPYPRGEKGTIVREVWKDRAAGPFPDTKLKFREERPIKVGPGVIHVEAEDFDKDTMGGQGGFGAAKVSIQNCYLGGKQVCFPAMIGDLHLGYKIDVPKTGTYMMTGCMAAINWHQKLYVRAFGAMPKAKSAKATHVYNNIPALDGSQLIDDDAHTRWAVNEGRDVASVEVDYGRPIKMSCVMMDERYFNRVSKFNIEYKTGGGWRKILEGTNIGVSYAKKFPQITAQHVRLNLLDGRGNGGPTIWSFNMGTVMDGQAWLASEWTMGRWQVTKPTPIRLVKGPQTIWVIAPFQRGLAMRWFRFTPEGYRASRSVERGHADEVRSGPATSAAAGKLLQAARNYLANNMKSVARKTLEEIMRRFPGSPEAQEAKQLLPRARW